MWIQSERVLGPHIGLIALLTAAASVSPSEPPADAFTVHLPSVKLGYPGAEYWAEVEGPGGQRSEAFAVFAGIDAWTVPVQADAAGVYRLLRVERRQGRKREPVALSADSQVDLNVPRPSKRSPPASKVLVEAGTFRPFIAAEEPWCINDHTFVQGPDKTWHLFGITHPKPFDFFKDPGRRLAHATARTLLQAPWQAQPPAVTADWERYREYLLWAPHVVRHGETYYMFVCAGDKATHRYRLHLLTSPDLKDWKRHPGKPLLVDGFDGRDPMVLAVDGRWVMYYTATSTPDGGNHIVACVSSPDLVRWADRRVVFVHPQAGTFGGPTESPFVVRRGAQYYLFACDNDWTDVYLSSDPFHWELNGKVGRIRAHAAELVRDVDGRWYISHAGWMNGPVELAPLQWHDGLDNAPTSLAPGIQ